MVRHVSRAWRHIGHLFPLLRYSWKSGLKEGESKKNFLPKDAYRVTLIRRKKLGHSTCPWARSWKWQQTRIFGNFSPDQQIVFFGHYGYGMCLSGTVIWKNICHNLGYTLLKYLWLAPQTSKDIQNQKCTVFFPVTVQFTI